MFMILAGVGTLVGAGDILAMAGAGMLVGVGVLAGAGDILAMAGAGMLVGVGDTLDTVGPIAHPIMVVVTTILTIEITYHIPMADAEVLI